MTGTYAHALAGAFAACLALSGPARADYFKIETNDWSFERPVRWSGKLISIDRDTGIATFEYLNRGQKTPVHVHLSRIYSVEFNGRHSVNKAFPKTRQALDRPLDSTGRIREYVELSNDSFVGDDLPGHVRVRPKGKEGPVLTVIGHIAGQDAARATLVLSTVDNSQVEVVVAADVLSKWIRGR